MQQRPTTRVVMALLSALAMTAAILALPGTAAAKGQQSGGQHDNGQKPDDHGQKPDLMERRFALGTLNDSGVQGQVKLRLAGDRLFVRVVATGLAPNLPHAQHIHGVLDNGPNTCPDMSMDADGDGILTVAEGAGSYGPIQVSLTTQGDTSPESALALDRFPVADAHGNLAYERWIPVGSDVADSFDEVHVVLHGIDFDHSGAYDGDRESSIAPGVPLEATVPAACGPVDGEPGNGGDTGDSTFVVDTREDTTDASIGDGVCADANDRCSLRAAVQEANANADHTTIELGDHRVRLRLDGTGEDAAATGDLDVTSPISIRGDRAKVVARHIDRIFDVASGAELNVHGVIMRRGAAPDGESGGAIRNLGTTTLVDVKIAASEAVDGAGASGGAILNAGWLSVRDSVLVKNDALRAGGAIEATDGSTTEVDDVKIRRNHTGDMPGNGGGIHVTDTGTVTVRDSVIVKNTATNEGGGVWNSGTGTITLIDTRVDRNQAPTGPDVFTVGGPIFVQ